MSDRKTKEQLKAQQQLDQLPPHIRGMLNDEWRRLRELKEPAEDITRGSWI